MLGFNRRKFISSLSALPLISDWKKALTSAPPTKRDPSWESKSLAVESLRLINTAQHWHFVRADAYSSKTDLSATEGFSKLKNHCEKSGRFRRPFEVFAPAKPLEMPGFEIWLECSSDLSKYTALMVRMDFSQSFAFGTDEQGIIYEGRPLEGRPSGHASLDRVLGERRAIGTATEEASGVASLFASILNNRFLSLMSTPFFGRTCVCCPDYPTPCGCTCAPTCLKCNDPYDDCCFNIGCGVCIFCREARCVLICNCDGCLDVCDEGCNCVS